MTYDAEAYAAWKRALVVGDDSTMMLPSGVSVERIAQLGVVATDVIYGLTPQDIEFAALYVEEDQLSAYGVCTCFNRKCAYSPCKGECGCSACNSAYYDAIDWD